MRFEAEKPSRTSDARRRQRMIQDPELREHRGLVPIETLTSHFAVLKLDDADEAELDTSPGGGHAREHPVQRASA